ncbi:MAG: hypothetical protein E6K80_02470 [Candidatus Eisenbacteria bacterium]|uniref:DUF4013 domain-containing protein n=1 Tax=Eiseniibacteriota bacterium TaxID=2212470 RepID=A0A538U9L2_UNCEI|nr:MAG: hypothetical protein E6K80_02470 [Candidatus Eisenbacteria bacterium]
MSDRSHRLPISTRRAFALAFDLAVRRDALHSLVLPVLMRAPWAIALAPLPPLDSVDDLSPVLAIGSLTLIGDFVTLLVIGAMLRFRARSVFNAPRVVRPAPAGECYARGLRRIPWLFTTEVVRNGVLGLAAYCTFLPTAYLRLSPTTFFEDLSHNFLQLAVALSLLVPTLFIGFRLGVATESIVLDERDLAGAFQRSFRMMRGHFERWFELVAASGALVLGLALLVALLGVLVPSMSDATQVSLFWLLVIAATPIIQYAWTFFYLRLVEIDEPMIEVGPLYATKTEPKTMAESVAAPGTSPSDRPNGARV